MVKCGAFFAVRTELLNIIQMSFGFRGLNTHTPVTSAYEGTVSRQREMHVLWRELYMIRIVLPAKLSLTQRETWRASDDGSCWHTNWLIMTAWPSHDDKEICIWNNVVIMQNSGAVSRHNEWSFVADFLPYFWQIVHGLKVTFHILIISCKTHGSNYEHD
jgi:hypothetical protein